VGAILTLFANDVINKSATV